MDRNEVDRRADVSGGQLLDEPVAVDSHQLRTDAENEEVPSVSHVRMLDRQLELLDACEGFHIEVDDLSATLLETRELAQLLQANGGLQVGHVVLEARGED